MSIPLYRALRRLAGRVLRRNVTVRPQLEMLWPGGSAVQSEPPPGFQLTTYSDGYKTAFLTMMAARFRSDFLFDHWMERVLPDGFFLVVHEESGELAAACMASHVPALRHPDAGNLGWLATGRNYEGRGLGTVVASAVTNRLVEAGYNRIYLETHDEMIPAISVYLKLGWIPYLYSEEMVGRWESIFETLKRPFTPEDWKENVTQGRSS
jgi:mycothiol synthase